MKKILPFFISIFLWTACKKDKDKEVNLPPSAFQITIADIQPKSASLTWSESKDPEGGSVTYHVLLGADTVTHNSDRHVDLNNLEENKKYEVSIIAIDPQGVNVKQSVSFTTTEYSSPSAFDLSVVHAGGSVASIKWTPSILPDNSPVSYDIFLNDSLIKQDLPDTSKSFQFKGLKELTTYDVKVIAKSIFNKTQQSIKQFTTKEDPVPTGLNMQVQKLSYSIFKFSIDEAKDIEGQEISYSVLLDNVDVSSQLESTIIAGKEYTLRSLTPLKTYRLLIVARDVAGKTATREHIFTTLKQPILVMANTTVTKTSDGFIYKLETNVDYKPAKMVLYANGKAITDQYLESAVINGNTISYTYSNSVLPADGAYNIAANLFWGDDTEMSRTAAYSNYTFYNFKPTTVSVKEAHIDIGSYYKTYTIFFTNSTISPFSGYSIVEVVFGTQNVPFSIFRTGETTGYLTEFARAQFSQIDAGPKTGYVIMRDKDGHHKLDFTFSYW